MRPTNRLFLFALISFFLFCTVSVVQAFDPAAVTVTPVTCNDASVDGVIEASEEADYYSIVLVAGQEFIVDVDTFDKGASLDTLLEVYAYPDTEVPIALNDRSSDDPLDEDPYLMIPVDVSGTYYLRIYDSTLGGITGAYTLNLKCADQPTTSEFKWPVEVGDLIGSTGSGPGSFINITPADAKISLPFDLGVGRIADIEFDPSTNKLFATINESPGSLITFDPATGEQDQTFSLTPVTQTVPTVVALEAVENTLYGVQVDSSSGEEVDWVLVTMDITPGTANLSEVVSFKSPVRSLAYHPSEKILYGASGTNLIKIDLASSPVGIVEVPLTGLSVQIVALDFSHEDVLYGVDGAGNLFNVPDLSTGLAEIIGSIDVSTSAEGVSGLTFVVGEPPDVEPIKTICSSTYTTSASASSGTVAPKLSKFTLKKNPLHRAVGLFKFEGIEGETVTLRITAEEESAEAVVEESSVNELENPWLKWKGKGRVFLAVRDAIPGLDFRARKKEQLPLTLSATLPADGTYYVMLIRPLLRFYQTDYCLTLESDFQGSQAWKTFDVAWPNDESGDDIASTSAEEPEDVQNDTATLTSESEDDGSVPVALSTTSIEPTSAPPEEPVVETPVEVEPALVEVAVKEPVVETPAEVEPALVEVTVEEPVVETPAETDPVEGLR
jgi:hypothetical protein